MRVLFMGTPDFAAASLARLYNDGITVCGVFTQPDRPKNRGMKLAMSPVKTLALAHDTPVYQPDTLRGDAAVEIIRALAPDLIAVVAYGKILPKDILAIPPMGCVNIHGSILPKYRGSAPIQWAVLNGDLVTGVTAMYMAEGMDTGDIIAIKTTEIGENETAGELFDRLKVIGGTLLSETISAIATGTARRTPQDETVATYAPPLTKDMCPIDWTKTAREICNQVRGLNPWPVARAMIAGIDFKIFAVECANQRGTPGEILKADNNGLVIACSDGAVRIMELQAPGGKRMSAADYLRGHPICL